MLTRARAAHEKLDLHVGGLGSNASGALASVVDPWLDASENWLKRMRDVAAAADECVRENPWQAIGTVALVGVTLGYLLARRG